MMASWSVLLGGLLIWAVHLIGAYMIGEFVGDGGTARITLAALTSAALAGEAAVGFWIWQRHDGGAFDRWRDGIGLWSAALAALAIIWQTLPVLIS